MTICLLVDNGASEDAWSAPAPEERWAPPQNPRVGRVLVVDDEPIVRYWISRLLRESGHSVQEAEDGRAALGYALSEPQEFDLIITDVRMPVINGWELGRRVNEKWPNLPVLYISGYDLQQPRTPGTFLRKPFEPDDLLRLVTELLRRNELDA